MNDRQLIADLLSALEYHTEQTRPIEFSLVAIEAAREYLRKPAQQQEPSRRKGAHWTEDYPDSPVLDDFPIATQPSKPSYEELERIADDLQALCDKQAIRLGKLAAQQQEPVAYSSDVEFDDETEIIPAEQKGKLGTAGLRIALYIEPPASKPLTDEEISNLWCEVSNTDFVTADTHEFARAIEAAHGIGEQK